ncbi:hypothetical protein GCM10011450_02360 [Advenella faeciporci]|uniref:Uncharacterized protein n=1 Tax=Advenella faeciporci TaxID=797535 RepID=A0A918MWG4_9BURK|nr:hypothetical protein [Advenella faeciporci]GGW76261.1 hypothetical protein GCM10011450_02360 [Advenella faeciporci]
MAENIVKKISLTDEEKKAFEFLGDDVLGCFPQTAVIIGDAKQIVFGIMRKLEKYGINDIPYREKCRIESELRVLNGYLETNSHWVEQVSTEYENKHLDPLMGLYETMTTPAKKSPNSTCEE